VPCSPGVYLWKDDAGSVLYVGKAKDLRARMRQYVNGTDERPKIPLMMEQVAGFDYVVTENEVESLILELNLINQFTPPYNVDYRDDKSYPFIAVTADATYPAIKYTREKHKPGTRYFGPYTDARAARETIETLRRILPLCRSTCPEYKRVAAKNFSQPLARPCFDAHIGLGAGVCAAAITPDEYAVHVRRALRFLSGHHDELECELTDQMHAAAADLDYENAARIRNRLDAIARIKDRQTIVSETKSDYDIVGITREETIAGAYVLVVREGRVQYGNEYVLDKGRDIPLSELLGGFLARYYSETPQIPREIVVETRPDDASVLESYLADRRGKSVRLTVPKSGTRRRLLTMAERNATHTLLRFKARTHYDDERINAALLQLESALALPAPALRIESYDISTLHGAFSVGSMVVFTNGRCDKAAYRHFRIRGEYDEANDVAMMREVLSRRFDSRNTRDVRFGRIPDLLLIDGGKPQLAATAAVLDELGVTGIALAGLAKREEELWTTWSETPIVLPNGSAGLYLVKRIRDEAHRFAIEYHRKLRGRAMTASVLDEVAGIGPKKRAALLKHFGGIRRLRAASLEQLQEAPGMTSPMARELYALMHYTENHG
jgi:excinuclease ABC subunit C